jgi:hypothetical protein
MCRLRGNRRRKKGGPRWTRKVTMRARRSMDPQGYDAGKKVTGRSGSPRGPLARAPPHKAHSGCAPACRPNPTAWNNGAPCSSAANPWAAPASGTGPQQVEKAVDDLAHVDIPRPPATSCRWDHRRHQGPFFVGEITRITQILTPCRSTMFRCPHRSFSAP